MCDVVLWRGTAMTRKTPFRMPFVAFGYVAMSYHLKVRQKDS